jgi:hypothetical protein
MRTALTDMLGVDGQAAAAGSPEAYSLQSYEISAGN